MHWVALLAEGVDRNMALPCFMSPGDRSPSSRRAWIEMVRLQQDLTELWSPSSRRAWIEISTRPSSVPTSTVALLAEGVDRNWTSCPASSNCRVALLAEGVDRNHRHVSQWREERVALLAEGVDRNKPEQSSVLQGLVALLAEGVDRNLMASRETAFANFVALLAEGVDRNLSSLAA